MDTLGLVRPDNAVAERGARRKDEHCLRILKLLSFLTNPFGAVISSHFAIERLGFVHVDRGREELCFAGRHGELCGQARRSGVGLFFGYRCGWAVLRKPSS